MSFDFFYRQKPAVTQKQKQMQRLIMSPQMQQGIFFLQVPAIELEALITQEMQQNPILDFLEEEYEEDLIEEFQPEKETSEEDLIFTDENLDILLRLDEDMKDHFFQNETPSPRQTEEEKKQKTYQEASITKPESLYEHLMNQAKETFETKEEIVIAEKIIGNLDRRGFLTLSESEIAFFAGVSEKLVFKVLEEIQKFDPIGIGAKNTKESLLLQLKRQNKDATYAFKIVQNHFDDLLHNRITKIAKDLKKSAEEIVKITAEEILPLDLNPGLTYSDSTTQNIVPDLFVEEQEDGSLSVTSNTDTVPGFKLNTKYLKMIEDPNLTKEEKEYLKEKIVSAKWLIKNLNQRQTTLERIGSWLIENQRSFFTHPTGKLKPFPMKKLAEDLDLHESTIARAVSSKYLQCDRGVFSLKSFFSVKYKTDQGKEISSQTVRDIMEEIILKEDKKSPLSDQAISEKLKKSGIPCARRTVAKYRKELNIGNAHQRKIYH